MAGVVTLKEARDNTAVGGKASSLSKLIKAGFNVPPGFVITKFNPQEILEEFDQLAVSLVAVRSSAAGEDGAKDAWAGQLDTFLNVTRENLLDKVGACFKSAGSARAKAYASQKGIQAGSMAVIVQKMVPADVSGVAFSVHPVTNDNTRLVIESVGGLGEKLVSGTITPSTYVISKKTRSVVEKYLVDNQDLRDEQVRKVTEAVINIEKMFGFPVDVEWAFAKNELFILQSRPITTLG